MKALTCQVFLQYAPHKAKRDQLKLGTFNEPFVR